MINIRKKLSSIIDSDKEWTNIIIRHLSNNKCACMTQPPMIFNASKNFEEPNPNFRTVPDPECNICEGAGYIFEESLYKTMLFYPGFRYEHFEDMTMAFTEMNVLTVYIKGTEDMSKIYVNDIIFIPDSYPNGKLKQPILRTKKYIINDVAKLRLDHNKLEFIRVFAKPVIL